MNQKRMTKLTGLALGFGTLAFTGCSTSKISAPQPSHQPVTLSDTRDWNTQVAPEPESPEEVTAFAVSLGAQGRHEEAAAILEDKAGQARSRRNALNIQLYLAAANEYLQAGDTDSFSRCLAQAEGLADRYQRAAWDEQTRQMLALRDRLMASK